MRRPVLLSLAAVGGVIVLLGSTGIFAALSDTARSEINYIDSGALAASSDLQASTATFSTFDVTCGPFTEDLTSNLIVIGGPPGADTGLMYPYCLRNVGSQTVDLTALAADLGEIEMGCTGDEAVYDTSCGSGAGELGEFVQVAHHQVNCATATVFATDIYLLRDTSITPASLGTLGPGETRCFGASIIQSFSTDAQRQAAQSDRLAWRFAWTGQA